MTSTVDPNVVADVRAALANKKKRSAYNKDPKLWANERLGVHLWSVQQEIIESVRDNKRTTVASCHGSGKALSLDTKIPVPSDSEMQDIQYVTMREIVPGSIVLDEQGRPTKVIAVTPEHVYPSTDVFFLHTRAEIATPQDSAWITASLEHQWNVLTPQEQSKIRVLCARRGIKEPDWSYWMHRATTVTTQQIRHNTYRDDNSYMIVPATRRIDTALSMGYRAPMDEVSRLLADHGTVDRNGRLVMRMAVTIGRKSNSPDNAIERTRRGLKGDDFPASMRVFEAAIAKIGYKVSTMRRRSGNVYVYDMAVLGNVRPLMCWTTPQGKHEDGMSDLDAQAIILQANDIARATAISAEYEPYGGWRVTGTSYVRDEMVKCIEVDSDSHLYLAGNKNIPTHNSMIASVASTWWVDTHPPGSAIVVSTAPTYPQVHAILWEEIRKHHNRAKQQGNPLPGSVTMADNWNLPDGTLAGYGRKPKDGDQHAFQGIHRRFVLVIIDEACGVPSELWTGAEAITTNDGCRILVIGNPDDRDTDFGKSFEDPSVAHMWNRIRIPASVTPNLTGEPVPPLLNEVLVSKQWCDDARDRWGEDDPRYISKVLAKFPEANEASLFSPAVIATGFTHNGKELDNPPLTLYFGLDCARYGGDLNALVMYDGLNVTIIDSWGGMDTTSSATKALMLIEDQVKTLKVKHRDVGLEVVADIRVDAIGLGAGVVDTMAAKRADMMQEYQRGEAPYPWFVVREMIGGAAPPKDVGGSIQGYGNARAYWYDQTKHLMRADVINVQEHAKLKEELEGIRYKYKNGKLYIESKEEMRDRGVKSPDFADAFVYAVAPVNEGLAKGDTVSADAQALAQHAELEDQLMRADIEIAPY